MCQMQASTEKPRSNFTLEIKLSSYPGEKRKQPQAERCAAAHAARMREQCAEGAGATRGGMRYRTGQRQALIFYILLFSLEKNNLVLYT